MELFNKFRETVFLKEDSDLERQIKELKEIPDYINNKDIMKDIKLLEMGLQGEKEIAFELKNANIGMYVLHDITIKYEDLKAQIDYIIITRGYIYLVECKNMVGNITVDNKGEFIREYTINNRKIKEAIYSPYTQSVRHKDILKKIWLSKKGAITKFLGESSFDNLWYKSLVVLANSKSMLNTKYAPREIKNNIVRVDGLVRYIKNDLDNYNKDSYSNQKNMLDQGNKFLEMNVEEYTSFANKYKSNLVNKDEIIKELKQFRKDRANKMNIPAYYVFTDDELNKLLEKNIKDMNELRNSKVLSEIKIKCHGEEILKIINKK